jgi:hypothetical protein
MSPVNICKGKFVRFRYTHPPTHKEPAEIRSAHMLRQGTKHSVVEPKTQPNQLNNQSTKADQMKISEGNRKSKTPG